MNFLSAKQVIRLIFWGEKVLRLLNILSLSQDIAQLLARRAWPILNGN